jgi:hypothetical protein
LLKDLDYFADVLRRFFERIIVLENMVELVIP